MENVRFHVLLVGIDAYAKRPLHGCVNDIDEVQRLLVGPGKIPSDAIRRLASPHPRAAQETDTPATRANICAALDALAGEDVKAGHRVFIYYSGHGYRRGLDTKNGVAHRESLVPVDYEQGMLHDYELNAKLAKIVARTKSVTFILDCCHSAGVTRGPADETMTARSLDLDDVPDVPGEAAPRPGGFGRGIDDCQVVCACLDHESAYESEPENGRHHGLLTRAFIGALNELKGDALREVPWSHVWGAIRDRVEKDNSAQHVWMAGNPARAILAGPPVLGDPGFAISANAGAYTIGAGTMAGITEGAIIGVYGDQPSDFPPLDSAADKGARQGELVVQHADRGSARAVAVAGSKKMLEGTRGRLVRAAGPERMRCAVDDPVVAAALHESRLLEVSDVKSSQVRLQRDGDAWAVTDDAHELTTERPPLFRFKGKPAVAREVLEHYTRYRMPITIATRANDLAALVLSVRLVPDKLALEAAQTAALDEANSPARGSYRVRSGARVAFQVQNTSKVRLRVTLVNSAASGRVQLLGDHVIDANSVHVFWSKSEVGKAFVMSPPAGLATGLDRLCAIGRTALAGDLDFLRVDRKFSDIVLVTKDAGDADEDEDDDEPAPPDRWTAHQIFVRTDA
jgi:hypothetical protein